MAGVFNFQSREAESEWHSGLAEMLSRWGMLSVGLLVQSIGGIMYAYALYSGLLKQQFSLTQEQTDLYVDFDSVSADALKLTVPCGAESPPSPSLGVILGFTSGRFTVISPCSHRLIDMCPMGFMTPLQPRNSHRLPHLEWAPRRPTLGVSPPSRSRLAYPPPTPVANEP